MGNRMQRFLGSHAIHYIFYERFFSLDKVILPVPEGTSDIYIRGTPIPPQILAEILIRVNNSRDVGYVCPLVGCFIFLIRHFITFDC